MSRDKEIILDIVKACRLILAFTREMNQDDFLEDEKTQSSVLYQIIIIGERDPLCGALVRFLLQFR
ncbi:HepT-like ribonuclease domain-containing protein [Crocosphaera sp.]|uniref:HepT-like ribonuclease domain-containing protein n=1 Tax=Crocosphaera sp. TaxID=2729996 RepID=UPI003F1FA895|nr:DUF86 domain-containing protein [Crocosphaera sp.]